MSIRLFGRPRLRRAPHWNVTSTVLVEVFAPNMEDGGPWTDGGCKPLPSELAAELNRLAPDADANGSHSYELEIGFRSVGYDDPGSTYGPPEKCYPPEGEDERTVESVTLFVDGQSVGNLNGINATAEGLWREQIEAAEINADSWEDE